jgi:hypothetical protein
VSACVRILRDGALRIVRRAGEPGEVHTFVTSREDYLHVVVQAPFVAGDKRSHQPVGAGASGVMCRRAFCGTVLPFAAPEQIAERFADTMDRRGCRQGAVPSIALTASGGHSPALSRGITSGSQQGWLVVHRRDNATGR